jgi:DNA-binding SARP family transcriptional activator/tetratricopeptide (TPR) repeat protein
MLELVFLGNPVLKSGGLEVRAKTRKALVILAVLALEGRVSRDRVANLLWADSPDAKNSLRNALSSLRYDFGEVVQSDRSNLWLGDFTCDALEVLRGSLKATLNISGTFLESVTLPDALEAEDWLETARGRVLQAALRTLEAAEPSLDVLEAWCRLEPLSELAHQRLIVFLTNLGQRTKALEVFESFKTRLELELGVLPAPETFALTDALRLEPVQSGRVPSLPSLLLESRLVGRVSEFQRLVAGFHSSAQGSPRVVVFSGEPGIGKTRLAQEFLAWAAARDTTVISARAFEGAALAYQCIADALRRVRHLETRLSNVWLAELGRLLPELMDLPNLPAPVYDESLGRSRVFEAIAKLTKQLGHLVWMLDDAQWADAASLEVLLFVMRRAALEKMPVFLLVTVRSEAIGSIETWLTQLSREINVELLPLEAFSKDETLRLLEDVGVPPETLLEWLYGETGGQPLYIAETLRSLTESGVLIAGREGWKVQLEENPRTAPGVRMVIEARFARLSNAARLLLEAGAVLGQGFTFTDAMQVMQISESDALPALEECLRARVLLELPAFGLSVTKYTFSHDKLRETALQRLSAPRLQALQKLALTRVHGSTAQRAGHALGARSWLEAIRFSIAAANEAQRSYAWRDALTHLELARRILIERPDNAVLGLGLSSQEIGQLYGSLNQLLITLNEPQMNASSLAQEALKLARELGDERLEGHTLVFVANTMVWSEVDPQEVSNFFKQATIIFERINDQEGLQDTAMSQLSHKRLTGGDNHPIEPVLELVERAKNLSHNHQRWATVALADAYQSRGDWQIAGQHWLDVLERFIIHPISDTTAFYLENLAFCQTNTGFYQDAIIHARRSLSIKQQIDDNPVFTGMAAVYLAYPLLEIGELNEAFDLCQNAFSLRDTSFTRIAIEFEFAHSLMLLEQKRFLEAKELLLKALERIRELMPNERRYANYIESNLCAAYFGLENWEIAAQHAKNALEIREENSYWRGLHAPKLHHYLEVKALRHIGDYASADLIISRLKEIVQIGEPLEVNLALCQSKTLEIPKGWVLRKKWLETNT